jgi:hypothetical protein
MVKPVTNYNSETWEFSDRYTRIAVTVTNFELFYDLWNTYARWGRGADEDVAGAGINCQICKDMKR